MSATFHSHPAQTYVPANQPLMYVIKDTGGAVASDIRFWVKVKETTNTTTEIAKIYLTPNASSRAVFDLSSIVKDRLETDHLEPDGSGTLWDSTNKVNYSTNATRKYTVETGTFDGSANTESGAQATKVIFLVNGSQQIRDGLHPSFDGYYPTASAKKTWLTERTPNASGFLNLYHDDSDKGVMAFIHDNTIINGVDAVVDYSIHSSDGTQLAASNAVISSSGGLALSNSNYSQKIHYLGFAPSSLNFGSANPSNHPTWSFYYLWLTNVGGSTRVSPYITVNKKCGILKNQRVQIAYANRLGGWDTLTFEGNTDKTLNVESKPYHKVLGDYNGDTYTFDPSDRTSVPYQVTAKTSYTLRNQNFTIEENFLLEGLLKSEKVYMRYGVSADNVGGINDRGKWLPVLVDTKSLIIRDKPQSQIFDVTLNVTLAQESRC